MSALTPADLNAAFLKHFLPETLYLLEQDQLLESSAPVIAEDITADDAAFQQKTASTPASVAGGASVIPDKAAPATTPSATAIPKLPKVEAQPKSFEIIGENRKGVVVLVTLPDAAFKALPHDAFLTKILAAIGFGPEDVAFVNNVSGAITKFEALRNTTNVKHIISFASRLDTDLPHDKFTLYNPVPVDGVPVVFSQSLAVLDGDQEQKKLLWAALQRVFK